MKNLSRPLRFVALFSTLFLLSWPAPGQAETLILLPIEDTFVRGGSHAEESAHQSSLAVAARSRSGLENVRKSFLLFEIAESQLEGMTSARLLLAYLGDGIIATDTDKRDALDLLLFGVPEGDWFADGLTWETAPFHDKLSINDEQTEGLELLAEVNIDPLAISPDDILEINDPRLLEFLQKNPGSVTFILTSRAGPGAPGVHFFAKDGTGLEERKPRLILSTE